MGEEVRLFSICITVRLGTEVGGYGYALGLGLGLVMGVGRGIGMAIGMGCIRKTDGRHMKTEANTRTHLNLPGHCTCPHKRPHRWAFICC